MPRILLINPNSSAATTAMMVSIAAACCAGRAEVVGATATRAPAMIVDAEALAASAAEVVEMARGHLDACDGIIVAAFGDPGAAEIGQTCSLPVIGIGEAAMREAGQSGRRFGVATVTPALVASIAALADRLGLSAQFTGTRLTPGDPAALAADPVWLVSALAEATRGCIAEDGADAVIIGGGPLAQAADQLQPQFAVPIIKPIAAAVAQLLQRLSG
ncbi:aspartate/glutamate racemase family protein [Bradyrhizobium aeschynomenes]|uniref:aspartate/glutamate racemase family protein n=1 Tax=Bradyrhizobium aeschynomenes TaxID=2734909 RepID=UPI0015568F55|nr:aspartate/glutamate racemase family protein [Bradyrhizobium aeschynomenes]NPV25627.1 aspartate/glutamate racemase family protein [Bradyrhizobium aeschynomenes]